MASVSLPEFAKLRSQLLDVFIISSDFDLAQHFSCSVKTVECGQLFILACGQLTLTLGYHIHDLKITCAKFQRNRFIIDREIDEKHALQIYQNNCGPGCSEISER